MIEKWKKMRLVRRMQQMHVDSTICFCQFRWTCTTLVLKAISTIHLIWWSYS